MSQPTEKHYDGYVRFKFNNYWELLLGTDDTLTLVLKGHLYVEALLLQLIEHSFPHPKDFEFGRLRFYQKLKMLQALGKMDAELTTAYKKLNDLRNSYAHDPDKALTDQDIKDILAVLTEDQKENNGLDKVKDFSQHAFLVKRIIFTLVGTLADAFDKHHPGIIIVDPADEDFRRANGLL